MPRQDRVKRLKQAELEDAASKCRKLDMFFKKSSQSRTTTTGSQSTGSNQSGGSGPPEAGTSGVPSPQKEPVLQDAVVELDVASSAPSPPSPIGEREPVQPPPEPAASTSSVVTPKRKPVKLKTVQAWNFQWLGYELSNSKDGQFVHKVWCKLCRKVHDSREEAGSSKSRVLTPGQAQCCDVDAYIKGTTNIKKDTAKTHSLGKLHQDALARDQAREGQDPIRKSLHHLDDLTFSRLCKLFDWAYVVAKKEQSFTLYTTLVSTEAKHGGDVGLKYLNDKACKEFIMAIGITLTEELQLLFKNRPFYCSILFDGSSDKTLTEKEAISIKILEDGVPKIRNLGIASPTTGKAEHVHEALVRKCADMGLDLKSSCSAAAADGAAVNFGSQTGVLTRMKGDMPWLVAVHCVAHRLELALADAFKRTYFKDVIDDLASSIYSLYKRSPKKWEELNRVAAAIEADILKPVRATGTRWIPHRMEALKTLDRNYVALCTAFEDWASGERGDVSVVDAAKMKGYLKVLKSHKFLLHLAAYQDIVDDLSSLSCTLQSDQVPITEVRSTVDSSTASLLLQLTEPGRRVKEVLGKCTEESGWSYRGISVAPPGYDSDRSEKTIQDFHEHTRSTVRAVIDCINHRFGSFTEDEVLLAFDIFDPCNFPVSKDDLVGFGKEQMSLLAEHFSGLLLNQGCDLDQLDKEWLNLKLDVFRHHKSLTLQQLWQKMFTTPEKLQRYENIFHLVHIMLVAPVATAQVERQFSFMKRILGDWRLSLGSNTIETLLRIAIDGPPCEDFDPAPSVLKWNSQATRRPGKD